MQKNAILLLLLPLFVIINHGDNMKIKKGFAKRNIAGENIVVPLGSKNEFNGMITLNETGSFLWDCLCKNTTVEKVAKKVVDEYDVDLDTAISDVGKFVAMLRENNLLDE